MADAIVSSGISYTEDDVEEQGGVVTFHTGDLSIYLGNFNDTSPMFHLGLRFQFLAVPKNVEIVSASLTMYRASGAGTVTAHLYANDIGYSPAWSNSYLPSGITRTPESVALSNSGPNGTITFDVKDMVQRIVNRSDWFNGSTIGFLLLGESPGLGWMNIIDVEGSATADAHITIEYPLPAFEIPPHEPPGTFKNPFGVRSPWNCRPVNPTLDGSFVIPHDDGIHYDPSVTTSNFSVGIYAATADDPPRTIYGNGIQGDGQYYISVGDTQELLLSMVIPHWPAGATPDPSSDGHLDIYDMSTGILHSMWIAKEFEPGVMTVRFYSWTPLGGRGFGDPAHYSQGVRAGAVMPSAGIIRIHEAADTESQAYPHALCASLSGDSLIGSSESGYPYYCFPATQADDNSAWAHIGKFPEGTLLMLPSDFDGSGATSPVLRKIIQTLKIYGMYIVDCNNVGPGGTPWGLYAENGCGSTADPHVGGVNTTEYFNLISANLKRVTAVDGWIDLDGVQFDAFDTDLPLVSLRGSWTNGATYDSWTQSVILPPAVTATEYENGSQISVHIVAYAGPFEGYDYFGFVQADGDAKIKFKVLDQGTGATVCETDWYGHNENMPVTFKKPCLLYLYAKRGAGASPLSLSIRVTLTEGVPVVPLVPQYLSYVDVGIPTSSRLVYRNFYPQVVPVTPVTPEVVDEGGGHWKKKKKHHIPPWDIARILDEPEPRPVEQPEPPAIEQAEEILADTREISRIKTQMRLSSNADALQAMEAEIEKLEKHLLKAKRDAEDDLLLTLLL